MRQLRGEEPSSELKRFVALFDLAPVGYIVLDRTLVIQANPAAGRILGLGREALVGAKLSAFFSGDPLSSVGKMLAGLGKDGKASAEIELSTGSGSRWIWCEVAAMNDGLQTLSLIDITDRRRAEDALRASQARFEMAAEASSEGIWDWEDVRTPRAWWSPRFMTLLGYRPGDLDPDLETFFDLLHPDDRQRVREELPDRLMSTKPFETEYRLRTRSGEYRWFSARGTVVRDPGGRPVRMTGSIRDITENRQAAELVRQSERKFRTLADNSPDVIARFDSRMRHLYVSPAVESATGHHPSSFIGRSNRELGMPEENTGLWEDRLKDVIDTGRPQRLDFDFQGPGGLRTYSALLVPERDSSGSIESVLSVTRDITEQKQAQKALADSERRYRTLLDTLQEGIITIDIRGVTTFVNPSMVRMLGCSEAEIVGSPMLDFVHPACHAAVRERLAAGMTGPNERFRLVFLRKSGTDVPAELSTTPVYSDEGSLTGIIGSVMDITDRTAAEEAYQSLVDNSLHGLAIFQDGRIVFCNHALAAISGFSVPELRGLTREEAASRVHPDDRERVLAAMQAHLRGQAVPAVSIFHFLHKSGVTRLVETFSTLVAFRGSPALQVSYRDISERHRNEVALRESEERFRSVFDKAPVGAAIVSLEYRFMRVNDALCRITGYSNAELLALGFPDITHPDDLASDIALARRLVAGEIERYSLDKRYIRRTGEPVWVRLSVGLIRDELNNPSYFLPLIEDISERKQAEIDMRGMRDKLRHLAIHLLSAREEERRKIAQEIHDELGQSLTAMKMDLRWVEKRLPPGVETLQDKVRGIVGMADQTISMVQRIAGEIRPRMLDDLGLAAALEWLGKDFQRRTGLSCDVQTDFPESVVGGNAASTLYRIVQEALTNVARHASAHSVTVHLRKKGPSLELRITDDGVGITDDQIADSTSYGLLGIRERTQGLAGNVVILGERGRGTSVAVSVPLPSVGGLA